MTQSELAEAAGIGNEYISKIERGLGSPSLETLVKIAEALQIELKVLFDVQAGSRPSLPKQRFLKLLSVLKNLSEKDFDLVYQLARRLGKR
jgi:transcriptional regulator with XRE-family HTH domain